jgi:hypothetical protein
MRSIAFILRGIAKGASEIVSHSRLVVPAEHVEQLQQALESLASDLLSKVSFDLTGGGPLGSEVVMSPRRKTDNLFTVVTGGSPKGHIPLVAEGGHNLASALTSDAEFPADLGCRDVLGLGAEPKRSSIGKAPVGEAGGRQLLVQSQLITDPGPAQGAAQGERSTRLLTLADLVTPVGRRVDVAPSHCRRSDILTTMVVILAATRS